MGGWDCPHNVDDKCAALNDVKCNPGMKGCVLHGRVTFADSSKNRPKAGRKGGDAKTKER